VAIIEEERGGEVAAERNSRIQVFLSSIFSSLGGVFGSTFQDSNLTMASRAIAPIEHRGENIKPKNVVGVEGGRNRRVLQDIGNLVINPADPGANANVPKRITRAQLAALAKAAAEKTKV
ncbi:cyclin, partial [Trifolium pratense]